MEVSLDILTVGLGVVLILVSIYKDRFKEFRAGILCISVFVLMVILAFMRI